MIKDWDKMIKDFWTEDELSWDDEEDSVQEER
jgi:hypothetical protein